MSEPAEEPVDFRAYLRPIAARKWWIIGVVIAITAATYVTVNHKPKVYEAATSVFIQPSNDAGLFSQGADAVVSSLTGLKAAANQAELLQSRAVAADVKRKLKSPLAADVLRARISVTTNRDTDFIGISATGPSGVDAADLANAYARAFVQARTSGIADDLRQAAQDATQELKSLKGSTPQAQDTRAELNSRISQLRAAMLSPDGGATQVDSALGGRLIGPFPKRNAIFAFVVSLILGLIGAVMLEGLNRKFSRAEQLEEAYGLAILASVPHVSDPSPVVDGAPRPMSRGITEPMRTLRVSVNLQSLDAPIKVLLVTSATPAEGKTTVVRNLALAMAEAGTRVVVIEADLRLPSVAMNLGVDSKLGLTDVLLGDASLRDALKTVDSSSTVGGGSVDVLPAGSAASNPPAILGSSPHAHRGGAALRALRRGTARLPSTARRQRYALAAALGRGHYSRGAHQAIQPRRRRAREGSARPLAQRTGHRSRR